MQPTSTDKKPMFGEVPIEDELVSVVMHSCSATHHEALALVRFLQRIAHQTRIAGVNTMYYLEPEDLQVLRSVLETVMPEDTLPDAGSVHELLNLGLLAGELEGLSFVHQQVLDEVLGGTTVVAVIDPASYI